MELTGIVDYPIAADPVRELRRTFRRARAVEEATHQALDSILTHSLLSDDLPMLVRDLRDPVVLRSEAGGRTVLTWPPHAIRGDEFELTVVALSVLLSIWEPARSKCRPGQAWLQFEQSLVDLMSASAEVSPTIPEEIEGAPPALQPMLVNATWSGRSGFAGADSGRDQQCWRILTRRIAVASASMVGAMVRQPAVPHTSGPAIRLGLLAAACVADRSRRDSPWARSGRFAGIPAQICIRSAGRFAERVAADLQSRAYSGGER